MTKRLTRQQAFNRVWKWFVVEGHVKCMEAGACCYRNSNGERCAIGVLIPDKAYSPRMEGKGIFLDPVFNEMLPYIDLENDSAFYLGLQEAHDYSSARSGAIKQSLLALAVEYKLRVPGGRNHA